GEGRRGRDPHGEPRRQGSRSGCPSDGPHRGGAGGEWPAVAGADGASRRGDRGGSSWLTGGGGGPGARRRDPVGQRQPGQRWRADPPGGSVGAVASGGAGAGAAKFAADGGRGAASGGEPLRPGARGQVAAGADAVERVSRVQASGGC